MEALGKKMDNLNAFHIDFQVSDSFIHYSDQANFIGDFKITIIFKNHHISGLHLKKGILI